MALLALAACVNGELPEAGTQGTSLPAPVAAVSLERSQSSFDLERHYLNVQNDLLVRGLLRVDGGGPDVPFTASNLATNFAAIALSEELRVKDGRVLAGATTISPHRWKAPIRVGVHFGDTVPKEVRDADRTFIEAYVKRLARITGHPMSVQSYATNFDIIILHEDQRRNITPILQRSGVTPTRGKVDAVEGMTRNELCIVVVEDSSDDGIITNALAIVPAEHSEMMRRMCFHEEIAQGLGLFNDSPRARPSIFNDDEEFGRLTTHDEMLLRMLYDPRMQPGMSAASAQAMAGVIAAELVGGES